MLHDFFPSFVPGTTVAATVASPKPHLKEIRVKDLDHVKEYDYIIAGGGTAGCVLAARLTEDPNVSVLMIEAGHSDLKQIFSRIPAAFNKLFRTAADYDLRTTPQKFAGERKLWWPRGKMLGGCSSINAMIYQRNSPDDFNEWEEKYACKGWGYKSLEPYFKRAEGFTPSAEWPIDTAPHGINGPWRTGYSWFTPVQNRFFKVCEEMGIKKVADVNAGNGTIGATRCQTFIDPQGRRSSAAVAYLTDEVCRRPNLKIAVGQTVTKILIDKTTGPPRAVGVEMASSKLAPAQYVAKVRKDVLVTAGSIHTPQLLMLSGIGPKEELAKHKIELVKDAPGVGKNLQDHLFVAAALNAEPKSSLMYIADPIKSIPPLIQWIRTGKGPFATNVAELYAFFRTADQADKPAGIKDLTSGKNSGDLEFIAAAVAYIDHGFHAPPAGDYIGGGVVHVRPEAVGSITLTDASVFTPPTIDNNALGTVHDRATMLYGTKKLIQAFSKKNYGDITSGYYLPKNAETLSDAELSKYIAETAETIYHPVGTAKMGSPSDASVVVNSDDLSVVGIKGLRVCDASLMPRIVAGHPCAPVIAIAERFADILKGRTKA